MATIEQPLSTIVDPAGAGIKPRYENFIGGEWVAPTTGQYHDNLAPATGKPFTQIAYSGAADIELALDAAHAAKDAWGEASATERATQHAWRTRSPRAMTTAGRSGRRAPRTSRWPPITSATSRR